MKNLLIVLVALVVCVPAFVFAQEPVLTTLPEPEPSEFEYPTLSFGNVSIASQEGNEVKVMYQVGSVGGIVPEAHITLALRTTNENGALTIVDEQVIASGFTLGPENSPIMSVASYTIPPYLSGTYELLMLSRAQNGRISALASAGEVTAVASAPLTTTCTLDGQATTERPTILLDETLTLSCLLKNTGTESMTLEPSFRTNLRSTQGNPVATGDYPATPITVGAGEEQTVTLEVPKVSQPESYTVVVAFTDTTTNIVAGAVPFSYLVEGPRAHFTDVTFDRIPVAEGDTMTVYAAWSILGASLYPATLQASIGDTTGVCSNFVNESVTANTNTLTVPLTLARSCPDGKLSVSLVQTDVRTLATETYALALSPVVPAETSETQPTTEAPATPTPKSNVPLLVSFLLLLLVVAVVGYLMNRNKKSTPPPTILPLLFLLIASTFFFTPVQKTEAASVGFVYNLNCAIVSPCTDAATIWYSYSTDKNTYSPGEAITITLNISSDDAPYAPIDPYASFTVSGGSATGDLVSASLSAQDLRGGTTFSLTHSNLRAPMTGGSFTINVASGASGQPYLNPAAKNITGLTVSVPTCSFSGTLNWFAGDGSECSVPGVSYSGVASGQTRTANDSNASGNTYTGSITYLCNATGNWEYQSGNCSPNYSCQSSVPSYGIPWDAEESSSLSNNTTNWSYAGSDTATKCQYYCSSGYTYSAGSCIPISYSCQGSIPANASAWDAEESSGLSNNSTWWSHASSDGATKCQYRCGGGYTYSAGSCVPDVIASCGTAAKTYAYNASSYTGAFCGAGNSVSPASPSFPAQGGSSSWTCYGTNDSDTCTANRESAPIFSCTGSDPANATLCSGDNTGLSANTAKTVVNSCTAGTKCEFTCGSGYTKVGSSCVAACADGIDNDGDGLVDMADPGCSGPGDVDESNSFSCTGSDPANATLCSGDNTGLSANTAKTVVNSCTAGTKCEFTCASGYTNSGGTCVATTAYSCQGSIPANASAWDSEESSGLSNNTTNWSYAGSDTATKCQYRCGSGYTYSGGVCVATSAYPDLSAAAPTLSTGSVQQNGTINFTGIITNIGSVQAGTYSNGVFYIDANGDGSHEYTVSASAVTNTTAAGDSRSTTGSWPVPAPAPIGSNYRVSYYADVNNNVNEGVGDGPWANWSGWSASFSVTSASTFSCTGTDPANATLCSGDNTGLSANTAKTVVNSCTAGTKCEFTCASGYTNSGGTCVAIAATSGDITATNCTIPTGAGNCQSTVSWTSSGITPSVRQDGLQFSTVASNNVSRTISKGTTFFSIWDTSSAPETMEDAIGVIADCDVANAKYNNITGLCEANLKPTITASPQVVEQTNPASNSTISWTLGSYLVADCSLSGPGLTAPVAALSQSIPITARSIFTITCGNAPPVSASVTVELRPQGFET